MEKTKEQLKKLEEELKLLCEDLEAADANSPREYSRIAQAITNLSEKIWQLRKLLGLR